MLVLFFPVGLYLMWSHAKWSRGIKWFITCIFGMFILVGALSHNDQSKETNAVSANNVVTSIPTSLPKAPQTLQEKINAQLNDGQSASIVDARDIDTNALLPGKKEIDITLNLGEGFWDTNAAKSGVWKTTAELTQSIFPMDGNIYLLQITANVPTTNAYGKKDMTELELITITRGTYNKISWDNFGYKNIPTIADTYFENKNIK